MVSGVRYPSFKQVNWETKNALPELSSA